MNKQAREDILCNQLIDLYLKEKEVMGQIPAPMPVHTKHTFALASVLAAPLDPLHYINTHIADSVYRMQENASHITQNIGANDAIHAQLWYGIGILGIAALLGQLAHDPSKQKLHTASASLTAPRLNQLQDIDLLRYSLTIENGDIFEIPHHRYPETPKRYMALKR
jgi:hypothetical protein